MNDLIRKIRIFIAIVLMLSAAVSAKAIDIVVEAGKGQKEISPYIYGKNNSLSDNPGNPLSETRWQLLRDVGIQMFRETGGNNSTKYNWERKLSSHPDWYNNVYAHDWDYESQSLHENIPYAQGMWSFQLIGKAAKSTQHNFNDWAYNSSQWWEGVHNNWAGGGGPDDGDGNPDLYLKDWGAENTTDILDHWFNETGYDYENCFFNYWNMDNEPEIWSGTHDDVYPDQPAPEEFLEKYIAVAWAARQKYPGIKLVGPVAANEWQWYNWDSNKIEYQGKMYVWLEYFILRMAEEEAATGVRMLDVLDIHFYPNETDASDIVQLHRVWFDREYVYPGANGVKRTGSGGWTASINKEYVFGRCQDWLNEYFGEAHGIGLGVSEMGIKHDDPNVVANWYASTLGVFANEGVEIFTPWAWKTGMYEVLHLMSQTCQEVSVEAYSNNEELVSGYASMNTSADSLTLILVNRDLDENQIIHVNINDFTVPDADYSSHALSDLPDEETFVDRDDNHLAYGSVRVAGNQLDMALPPLSVTSVQFSGKGQITSVKPVPKQFKLSCDVYPNPFNPETQIVFEVSKSMSVRVDVYDLLGKHVVNLLDGHVQAGRRTCRFSAQNLTSGTYFVKVSAGNQSLNRKMVLMR